MIRACAQAGVYPVALAYLLLGEPDSVQVAGSLAECGVDADAALLMTWPGGVHALLECSLVSALAMNAVIAGTKGRIDIDPAFHAAHRMTARAGLHLEELHIDTAADDALAAELREVRDGVRAGLRQSPAVPLDATLAALRILENAREALGAVAF
ncbi:MAG TPA: hypothetical protein VLH10_18765 [Yinghuangia sp.]|nr:hypothetical protein [Yinghuangia sp.]